MVALTPRFASLVAFVVSSSLLMGGVEALPHSLDHADMAGPAVGESARNLPMPALVRRHQVAEGTVNTDPSTLETRDHHHHHHHHHHGDHHHHDDHHDHDDHATKVYADDPLIVSGDNNHIHSHSHKRRHSRHGHHGHHETKVYADDPLIVSGDNNHVHSHSHKRSPKHHHGDHHRHHGDHHGTKVYADDPLIVSGDNNHVHSHSHKRNVVPYAGPSHHGPARNRFASNQARVHARQETPRDTATAHQLVRVESSVVKRGLLDTVMPLVGGLPIVSGMMPGIIDLVNMGAHMVLSDTLASLIISPKPAMSALSTGDSSVTSFSINASNSTSTTMYLSVQNTTLPLGKSEKAVLITMPMFNKEDQSVKMYCATYDSNATSPSPLSSEPCTYDSATPDNSTTSSPASQLFAWNTKSGEITPLWYRSADQPLVDTTSAPGGAPDPASQGSNAATGDQDGGFVVGGPAVVTEASAGKVLMVFRASNSQSTATSTSDDQQSEDPDANTPAPDNGSTSDDSNDEADDSNGSTAQGVDEDPAATASMTSSAASSQETAQGADATPTSSDAPIPTEPATQESNDSSPSSDVSSSIPSSTATP